MPAALAGAGFVFTLGGVGIARAEEPRNTTEPHVMKESGNITNVIDAFDDGDPFDLNISLGFDYASKNARILRETAIAAPGLTTGGFNTHLLNVASYAETTARLTPRIDVGLYHDIAAHITLPIILSNTRSLGPIGSSPTSREALVGAPGEALFSVPFTGPTRSGLEYIGAGFDFDILNQARDNTKPTWLFGFEGRFSVGTPMHACNTNPAPGQVQCADPSDINRNGKSDGKFEGNFDTTTGVGRGAGVTRGTHAIEVHTLMSKRLKYVEPYGGFTALFEFQQAASDYGISDLTQSLVNHPPLVGTMVAGMEIIPWENREKFARLTFDLRFTGTYHSEGRDYSELFDALGSSAANSLRQPQWAGYMPNSGYFAKNCDPNNKAPTGPCLPRSVIDPGSQKTYTTGLSDVTAHGSFRTSGSVTWQVGEYVRFQFGLGYRHDQGHEITADAPCNPAGVPDNRSDVTKSGPCHSGNEPSLTSTGTPNPNYRTTISNVGRRYWVDGSNTFDLFAAAVVMF